MQTEEWVHKTTNTLTNQPNIFCPLNNVYLSEQNQLEKGLGEISEDSLSAIQRIFYRPSEPPVKNLSLPHLLSKVLIFTQTFPTQVPVKTVGCQGILLEGNISHYHFTSILRLIAGVCISVHSSFFQNKAHRREQLI